MYDCSVSTLTCKRAVGDQRQGDFFGEMGLLLGAPRAATCIAVGHVELLSLSHDALSAAMSDRPELRRALEAQATARCSLNTESANDLCSPALYAMSAGARSEEIEQMEAVSRLQAVARGRAARKMLKSSAVMES